MIANNFNNIIGFRNLTNNSNFTTDANGTIKLKKKLNCTNIMKNIYSNDTGEIIKILKEANSTRYLNTDISTNKKIERTNKVRFKLNLKSDIRCSDESISYKINKFNKLSNSDEQTRSLGKTSINNSTNDCPDLPKFENIKSIKLNTKLAPLRTNEGEENTNVLFIKVNNNQKINNSQHFYCPHCEHCNTNNDEILNKYIYSLREAKSIISKSFDYILNSQLMKKKNLDFFNSFDTITDNMNDTHNSEENLQINSTHNLNNNSNSGFQKNIFLNTQIPSKMPVNKSNIIYINDEKTNKLEEEELSPVTYLNTDSNIKYIPNLNFNSKKNENVFMVDPFYKLYPKSNISNRLSYYTLYGVMDALLEDKIAIENLISPEVSRIFNKSLIAFGLSFDISDGYKHLLSDLNDIRFDKELDKNFDDKFKDVIKDIMKKKNLLNDFLFLKNDPNLLSTRRKYFYIYMIFMQILSEISVQHKEKALLLYKIFKCYFAEQEKKWIMIVKKFKDKVGYYKKLCKLIIQQKNRNLDRVEKIADVLAQNSITKQNLEDHKSLIRDLLNVINEKRNDSYLKNSQIQILENELKFWIYDWESLRLNPAIREKFKAFNHNNIANNIKEEMIHKNLTSPELGLLINSDTFLLISGQRSYFYEQKTYYLSEIGRLTGLFEKMQRSKIKWKKKYIEQESDLKNKISYLETKLNYYVGKEILSKTEASMQTDVDILQMNKLIKSNESVLIYKNMNNNKLNSYIEKIKFGCSKEKPFSKKSLLNLITDVYSEKIINDSSFDTMPIAKKKLDLFFYNYMEEKFKLKISIKKHCEETILTILKYSGDDLRVDIFRQFLGVGNKQVRREILDVYLILLKSVPVSYEKLFESFESYESYTQMSPVMSTELCFEIFYSKLNIFNLNYETKNIIIKHSSIIENENSKYPVTISLSENKKFDYFLLMRFYNKSQIFISDLLQDYGSGKKSKEKLKIILDNFEFANKDFAINQNDIENVFNRTFSVKDNLVNLEEFFLFFSKRYYFRIKICDFIEICYNGTNNIFNLLEKKIETIFLEFDTKKNRMINLKDFETMMSNILISNENRWKINEYFM